MGLDISAYCNLTLVDDPDDSDCRLYKSFEYQFGDLVEGWYEGDASPHHFSRSYSGWSAVRERLAEIAGWPEWGGDFPETIQDEDKIFYKHHPRQAYAQFSKSITDYADLPLLPLINFSDCEGAICNEVCKIISNQLDSLKLDDNLTPLADLFRWAAENDGVVVFR